MFKAGNWLLHSGKVQIHQSINSFVGNPFFDVFFKYITHIGDGVFAILIVIITLFFNVKKSIYILLAYVFAALASGILKNYFFVHTCRPSFCFQHYARLPLKFVEGVELHSFNSFPSGHSTAAFAVFISLLFMSNNFITKFLWLLLACLAAYSRTYLSQHWLVDIYFGSILGFCFSLFFYFTFYTKNYSNKLDVGIIQLFKK